MYENHTNSTVECLTPRVRRERRKANKDEHLLKHLPKKGREKGRHIGRKHFQKSMQTTSKTYPTIVHESRCNKKVRQIEHWGRRCSRGVPPEKLQFQRSYGGKLPKEKHINRKIKDRESDARSKHASGVFGPGAD